MQIVRTTSLLGIRTASQPVRAAQALRLVLDRRTSSTSASFTTQRHASSLQRMGRRQKHDWHPRGISRLLAGPPPRTSCEPPSIDLFREEMASSFSDVSGLESLAQRAEASLDVSTLTLHSDGRLVRNTGMLDKAKVCHEFGLQARDLRFLDSNLAEAKPSILVRQRSIIYSSALLRAIITPDKLVVLDDPSPPDAAEQALRTRPDSASIAKAVALYFRVINSFPEEAAHLSTPMAWEHRALEAILMLITRGYRRALRKLEASALEVVDGLKADVSTSEIRALADTSRVVEDFLSRCTALTQTLTTLLHADDEDLNRMYLTAKRDGNIRTGTDHQEVEMLLEAMLQRADETRQNAHQLMLRLRNADQHMTLSLSATRNRLLLMELRVAVIMLSITTAVALPSLFGANLRSGFEHDPSAFYILAGVAVLLAVRVCRSGFVALSHTRRSSVVLPSSKSTSVEGKRRLEVSKRRQQAADQLKSAAKGNGRWAHGAASGTD